MILETKPKISRRTVLRGLGTAMALPFLEAMTPTLALAGGGKAAPAPVRMAFLYVPNGVHVPDWKPGSSGAGFRLPFILEPLEKVKEDILVLSGLTHNNARANGDGAGDHARAASAFLTGMQPVKTGGAGIRLAASVDQVAAQHIGRETRFPSLEIGCEPGSNSGDCDSGYSCAYSNNISWSSPTTPVGKEIDPRRVFDRLFADQLAEREALASRQKRLRERQSILDFVLEDARRLRRELGAADQRKVDEYLASIREVEKRIERAGPAAKLAGVPTPENLPASPRAELEYGEHLRLMGDMLVLAFQGDVTRIATFMLAREGSNRSYPQVNVSDGHHNLSHHQGDPVKHDKIRRINRFHVNQLAYLLERLKSIRDGEGTLLDNCMIVYGSGMSDGNAHNKEDLPVILAGRGGGTIDSGRHVGYPFETPMCNLFVSMLERVGVADGSFGDGTGPLGGLTT